jgi:hypothetical protein
MDAAIGIGANLHYLSALAPVHDDGLGHLVTRLLCGWQLWGCAVDLRLLDFQLDVLIPPKGAPSRKFQADEICTRVGLLSRVFAT